MPVDDEQDPPIRTRPWGKWSNPGMDITGKTAPEPEEEPATAEDTPEPDAR